MVKTEFEPKIPVQGCTLNDCVILPLVCLSSWETSFEKAVGRKEAVSDEEQ